MINYFDEAEKILRSRSALEQALKNLERRKERVIAKSAPAELPTIDFSKGYTSRQIVNDALSECLELAEVMREISFTRETLSEIDDVINQLSPEDITILRLWYIERKPKEAIAEELNYSSTTTIYDMRNKAVSRFALLYFGAGALSSTDGY